MSGFNDSAFLRFTHSQRMRIGLRTWARVDMLTSPVAAARAAVATGAWVKSKHDTYLIREVWELKLYFYPSARG